MGYPYDVLAAGEQVVWHCRPHWKRLIWPVVAFILLTGIATFGSALLHSRHLEQTPTKIIYAVIWLTWLALVGWLTLWPFLTWLTTHFAITNRRVMHQHGVLTRSGLDIPLARISSVEFRDRLIQRMFGTGTLVVESSARDPVEYSDLPRLREVHSLLYHEVFDDTRGSSAASPG